jgi:hypothetical protein
MKIITGVLAALAVCAASSPPPLKSQTGAGAREEPSGAKAPGSAKHAEPFFKDIDLDRFIEKEKATVAHAGKKLIARDAPIRFEATMKRIPEKKKMAYIYTAMSAAGVSPLPEVEHRMFIETKGRRIISVYVEKGVAARIPGGLKEGAAAQFFGYHVYSYDKGPAIMVVDFSPASATSKPKAATGGATKKKRK